MEREKERKENNQKPGSILAVKNPPMVTQAGEEEADEKESLSATESEQSMKASQSKKKKKQLSKLPTHDEEQVQEGKGDESATESEKSHSKSKPILETQPPKSPKLKKIRKAPSPNRRLTKRLREDIDRFKPNAFSRPKRRRTKRIKEVHYMPNRFTLAVAKNYCGDNSKEAANCLNSKVSEMGDRPLEFLGDPKINEKKWTTGVGYGPDQTNRKDALKYCMHSMNLPATTGAFMKLHGETQGKRARKDLSHWYKNGRTEAQLEADIMLVSSVLQLCFIPQKMKPNKGPLLGHYQMVVRRAGGENQTITPTNDWVIRNFKQCALAVVQKVAYEVAESMEFNEKTPIKNESILCGYINVEKSGVTCSATDTRVINRLKYYKAKVILSGPLTFVDKKGNTKKCKRKTTHVPPKWVGWCNQTKECITLADEWVTQNFHHGYLKQVVTATGSGKPYVIIPPGDFRNHPQEETSDGPVIHYRQKEGTKTCMSLAMANALHYLGHREIAFRISRKATEFENKPGVFKRFGEYLRHEFKILNKVTYPKTGTIDLLSDIDFLYLTTIQGNDGKEDHCVALTSSWIFDANFKQAMPRTRSSLDQCCSSDDVKAQFVRFVLVAAFPKVKASIE